MNARIRLHALTPALLAALFYCAVLFRFAQTQFGGNVTGFSYISRNYPAPAIWTDRTFVREDDGYDGMFYYYIAHDPFIRTDLYRSFMDGWTAYRYQRIAYPLTVFTLSLGKKEWIPYGMVLVNVLAVAIGVFFCAKIAEFYGKSPYFSIAYALIPGLFLSVTRNLTEPLQMALICGGTYFYICKNRTWVSALFLGAAALAKDTALLVPFAFFLLEVFKHRRFRQAAFYIIPPVLYFAWRAYVVWTIGESAVPHGEYRNFGGYHSLYPVPFVPFFQIAAHKWSSMNLSAGVTHDTVDALLTLSSFAAIALSFREFKFREHSLSLCALLFGVLGAFVANPWIELYGYGRTLAPLSAFLLLIYFARSDKLVWLPLGLGMMSLATFLRCAGVL